ncbi:Trichome birefringence-like, N-terminal domain [Dillenia turbinata]|uniref:Trichome birefringence-like, N-terminal domain n=1 Tax=Dillenia turbinata TaxID=194707 RepID=A0AAN8ZJB3_9MAGN
MAKNNQIVPSTWGIRYTFQSLIALLVASVLIAAIYVTEERGRWLQDLFSSKNYGNCNYFSGRWLYDNHSSPEYDGRRCSYMSDQFACEKFGRTDMSYLNWKWQPDQCDLPRFNATALLENLRNKRLVYVGDSLNRNLWISMLCMVEWSIPPEFKSFYRNGSKFTFEATEYNATIEFDWAPLLVESNSDNPINHLLPDRFVRIQAIEKHARLWSDADILVFDSYLWWPRSKMKALWGEFDSPEGIYKEVQMPRCYEMALQTWSNWLEIHVNRSRTRVFWVSMSPTHELGEEWGKQKGQNCYGEKEPIFEEGYWGSRSDPEMMRIVEAALNRLRNIGFDIQMLNITQLAEYRKDGHPSIYRKFWHRPTEEQLSDPANYSDCTHWCLPGVPDTWNQILYARILHL